MRILPKVTTSVKEFAEWVSYICERNKHHFSDEKIKAWKKASRGEGHGNAHYFYNVIYIDEVSFYLIFHEYIHHLANWLRYWTVSPIWFYLDDLNDKLGYMRDNLLGKLLGR